MTVLTVLPHRYLKLNLFRQNLIIPHIHKHTKLQEIEIEKMILMWKIPKDLEGHTVIMILDYEDPIDQTKSFRPVVGNFLSTYVLTLLIHLRHVQGRKIYSLENW